MNSRVADLKYLAGMIDGEGCFNVTRCRTTLVPRIIVTNTNGKIMGWLKRTFGGNITRTTVKTRTNWKPRYQWQIQHQGALELAEKLYYHLVIKDEQALRFMMWKTIKKIYAPSERKPFYGILVKHLHKLNAKGL